MQHRPAQCAQMKIGFLVCIAGLPNAGAQSQLRPNGFEVLLHADSMALDNFTLEIEVENAANFAFPELGRVKRRCRATADGSITIYICEAQELPTPGFLAPGTRGDGERDYDDAGNFVAWMESLRASLRSPIRNDSYAEHRSFHVAPNGSLVRESSAATISRFGPSEEGFFFPLRTALRCLGRGFAKDAEKAVREWQDADNVVHLRVVLSASGGGGEWELTLDPISEGLVRTATMARVGGTEVFQTEGARSTAGASFAERGEYRRFRDGSADPVEIVRVRLVRFSPGIDKRLVHQARELILRSETMPVTLIDERGGERRLPRRFEAGEFRLDE